MPVTSCVPKALFPLVDGAGRITTILQVILEQVKAGGVDEVALIVSPGQQGTIESYLYAAGSGSTRELPKRLSYIDQREPLGFGHAVYQGRSFADNGPIMVFLGDYIHIAAAGSAPCARQIVDAFAATGGAAMVGVQAVDRGDLSRVGVATGERVADGTYRCTRFVEKPTLEVAEGRLKTRGVAGEGYLGHCGVYLFDAVLFDYLEQVAQRVSAENGEMELAAAQSLLLENDPANYYLCEIKGRSYDTGTPMAYAEAFRAYHSQGQNTGK
ncbi:MAG: hypothetical protein IIA65_04760 [Planctomycetes bacterium]|nr:hypothetical protein [Planctomycetota bacterium]